MKKLGTYLSFSKTPYQRVASYAVEDTNTFEASTTLIENAIGVSRENGTYNAIDGATVLGTFESYDDAKKEALSRIEQLKSQGLYFQSEKDLLVSVIEKDLLGRMVEYEKKGWFNNYIALWEKKQLKSKFGVSLNVLESKYAIYFKSDYKKAIEQIHAKMIQTVQGWSADQIWRLV